MEYMDEAVVIYWILLISICILVFLSFLEKSNRYKCCGGRPGIVMPLSFLDGYENRAGYVLCFGVCMTSIILLFLNDPEDQAVKVPGWAKVIYYQLSAILVGVRCYPYFVCLTASSRCFGVILSIAYIVLSFGMYVATTVERFKVQIERSLKTKCFCENDIECFLTLLDVSISLIILLFLVYCILIILVWGRQEVIPGTAQPHQVAHVRWILRKNKDPSYVNMLSSRDKTFVDCMTHNRYRRLLSSLPFFKYSTRICTMAGLQFFSVYMSSIFVALVLLFMFQALKEMPEAVQEFLHRPLFGLITFSVLNMITYGLWTIFWITAAYCLLNIFLTLRNYRYEMLKIYQGEENYLKLLNEPPQNTLTSNLRCIGYTVAFTVWGFIITYVLFLLFASIPPGIIYLLYRSGALIDYIVNMISIFIITFVIKFIQLRFTRQFLLQDRVRYEDRYRPLNVDNRKVYEISHYFFLFMNMAVGVMTCAWRVLLSALFGGLSISRLDRSTMSRDHEKSDSGYMTFISMLVVDNAHNNPTMRVFAHLLWTKVLTDRQTTSDGKKQSVKKLNSSMNISMQDMIPVDGQSRLRRKRAVNRRFLAYTFIHNPQLRKRIII